jgi:hypothetical protein
MANNMESFNFDALDWQALDETLSFLNSWDPSVLPDPVRAGSGDFQVPMIDGTGALNEAAASFGNDNPSPCVTDSLTDNAFLGPNPFDHAWNMENCLTGVQPHLTSPNRGE